MKVQLLADQKIIIETLNRMGIINHKTKEIFPSCYLFEDINEDDQDYITYHILHFKEVLMASKYGYNNFSDEDLNRKNAIIFNLQNWGLIETDESLDPHDKFISIVPFKDKHLYQVIHKIRYK